LYGGGSFDEIEREPDTERAMRFLRAKHYLEDDEEIRKTYFQQSHRSHSRHIPEAMDDPKSGETSIPVQNRRCPIWDAATHIYRLKRNVITVPLTIGELKRWVKEGTRGQQKWLVGFLSLLEDGLA